MQSSFDIITKFKPQRKFLGKIYLAIKHGSKFSTKLRQEI